VAKYFLSCFFRRDWTNGTHPGKWGTDRLGAEKGKNLKLESFLFPFFCVIFRQKSKGKWIRKRDFGQSQNGGGNSFGFYLKLGKCIFFEIDSSERWRNRSLFFHKRI
jgi:hypothetical protein